MTALLAFVLSPSGPIGHHMRRSLGAFRAVGVNAVPAIGPDPLPTRWFRWIAPTDGGLESSGEVVHELLGILYDRLRGRWRR
jgi:hypothetical protein